MLREFREFQENVELARVFGLPVDDEVLVEVDALMKLEYDEELKGFWDKVMCETFCNVFRKLDILFDEIDTELGLVGEEFVYSDFVGSVSEEVMDRLNEKEIYLEALSYVVNILRDKVGLIGDAITGDRWSEIKNALGLVLSEEMEERRIALSNNVDAILDFDSIDTKQKLEEFELNFPELTKVADLFKRKLIFDCHVGLLLGSHHRLFELMSVDSNDVFQKTRLINTIINRLIDEESHKEEELNDSSEKLFWDKSDNGEVIEAEFLTPEELYGKVSSEEFTQYKSDLDTFLKNPKYIRSLLSMFGSFKVTVERENENRDDVFEITKLFLEKCIFYANSKGWTLETSIIFKETLKSQFRSYGFIFEIVELIESLSFEEEYENEQEYEFYYPASIRFVNNERIDIKDFKKVVRSMGGYLDGNGKSKHAQFVIPFEEFTFTYALPTNYFIGKHSRYARVTINELADFLDINGIDGITKDDFISLRDAYSEIGIEIEYRP